MNAPESAAPGRLPTRVPVLRPGGGFDLRADFGAALDTRVLLPAAIPAAIPAANEERRVVFPGGGLISTDPESPRPEVTMRHCFSRIPGNGSSRR